VSRFVIDLSRLLGGQSFEVPCRVSRYGTTVNTKALVDTGANGFLFIDSLFFSKIRSFISLEVIPLKRPLLAAGYDGKSTAAITDITLLTLTVDRRRFVNTPALILPLGRHEMIIGREWLSVFNILPCPRQRFLSFPAELPPSPAFSRDILIDRRRLDSTPIEHNHQADMLQRDLKMSLTDGRWQSGRKSPPPELASILKRQHQRIACKPPKPVEHPVEIPLPPIRRVHHSSYDADHRRSIKLMIAALHGFPNATPKRRPRTAAAAFIAGISEDAQKIDIAMIGAAGFALNLRRKENEFFTVSIHELSRHIDERHAEEHELSPDELVAKHLPDLYRHQEDVFSKDASDKLPPRRHIDHKIKLQQGVDTNQLGFSPLYRMTLDELEAMKKYLDENLAKGFIVPSNAAFAAPVLFVKKPNGSLRFCIDFRKLNSMTVTDQYPLPLIDEILGQITKAKIFTKLDIRQAFHRIRIHPDSEDLTTFRTRYGSFKCRVLPFGLTNGPSTYQRYMNEVLFDYLDEFCTVYLDDILIYSSDPLEHEMHVNKVLNRLRDAGLQVDIKKCEFHVTKTKYLGFIISTDGIEVDPAKREAVISWLPPTSVRAVQSFLGFCNFYRRFIPDYGRIARPLTKLTVKGAPFVFDDACFDAFESIKWKLTNAPILRHYDYSLESRLETDASDGVVSGVLSQLHPDGEWYPVGYYSKTMDQAEVNYAIHDKEMLAIVRSFDQWRAELAGSPSKVNVYTDHEALKYFMTTKKLNQRQARWAELLSAFYFEIVYRPGTKNVVADTLTRREQDIGPQEVLKSSVRESTLLSPAQIDPRILETLAEICCLDTNSPVDIFCIDYAKMTVNTLAPIVPATAAQETPEFPLLPGEEGLLLVDRIMQANRISPELTTERDKGERNVNGYSIKNGLLLWNNRLVVPQQDSFYAQLIREAHDQPSSAHPSIDKTTKLIASRYYWKGLSATVETYVRNCHLCRRSHVPRDKTPGYLHPLPIPDRPWQHITMDHKSFPKDARGYDEAFVIIDRFSKQAISIPCYKTITAEECARLFIEYVYRYKGAPESIVSDRGPQFVSTFWREFQRILGVKLKYSSGQHPQTDGQTEIMNQYLDQRLRPFVNYFQDNWSDLLPIMDYAQLVLPHDALGMSPFELLNGYRPTTSFDWERPDKEYTPRETLKMDEAKAFASRMHDAWEFAKDSLQKHQARMERSANKHRRAVDFGVGDEVYLKTKDWSTDRPSQKLDFPMAGPYKVTEKVFDSFKLKLPSTMDIHPVFSTDKLRLSHNDPLPGQVNEPTAPVVIAKDEEWEVEEVVSCKRSRGKQLRYKIIWRGDPLPHDEWMTPSDIKYSPHLIKAFHLKNPALPGPPKKLLDWIKAYEAGVDDYDYLEDDQAMDQSSRASFFERGG
jgi:predicted aspartyl protease